MKRSLPVSCPPLVVSAGRGRRAFTLAETALATLLVGMVVVASLKSLAASYQTHRFTQDRVRAQLLAEQLLVEVSSLPWSDPDRPTSARTIGRDIGDPFAVTHRSQLDDMDDFDGWVELPVADRGGAPLKVSGNWRRAVSVENISSSDPTQVVADDADNGFRRVTVMVMDADRELAQVSCLFARAEGMMRSGTEDQRSVPHVDILPGSE